MKKTDNQFALVTFGNVSEDSRTIVSAENELLHDFVNIDAVDDVLMRMTQGNTMETLLAAQLQAVADDARLTSKSLTRHSTC